MRSTLINKFLDPEIDLSPAGIEDHAIDWLEAIVALPLSLFYNTGRPVPEPKCGDVKFVRNNATRQCMESA